MVSRVVKAVADLALDREGVKVPLGVSAGVAERHGDERIDGLLRRADEALYRAKQAGRNRVAVAT